MSDEGTPQKVVTRNEALKGIRAPYINLCQDVTRFFDPDVADLITTAADQSGVDQGERTIPDVATFALYVNLIHTSGVYSNTIGSGKRFFNFRDADPEQNEKEAVTRFYAKRSDRVLHSLQDSNFDIETLEAIRHGGMLGTTVVQRIFTKNKTKFKNLPIYQCCIAENEDGDIDTLFYEYQLSAEAVASKWPETASESVKTKAESTDQKNELIKIIKACYPRKDFKESEDGSYDNPLKREYEIVYVEAAQNNLLEEDGDQYFPYIVSRIGPILPGTPYARGMGVQALPTLRLMNTMLQDLTDGTEALLKPVVFGPAGIEPSEVDLRPGAFNPIMDQNAATPLVWTPKIELGPTWNYFMELVTQIRNLFMVDLWLAMEQNRSDTATEAEIRQEEKFQSVTPIAIRWMKLFYSPVVKSQFNLLANEGILDDNDDEIPEDLANSTGYEVEYVTRLNALLNAFENNMIMQTAEMIAGLYKLTTEAPQLKHILKLEELARDIAYNNNMDPDRVIPVDVAKEAIAAEEKATREQQVKMEMASKMGNIDLAKKPEEGSPLAEAGTNAIQG